jgi:serine/threonine-protein kinase HipA
MFETTRRLMAPTDILRLLDMVIFNVIACNTDAHAKNYSMMINAGGVSLAPLYDVMCGEVWENITRNLAQKIAGKRRGDHLQGRHWQRFARDRGLGGRQVLARVRTLSEEALAQAEAAAAEVAAMPAGGHVILDQARHAIERRARALRRQVDETEEKGGEQCDDDSNATDDAEIAES